VTTGRERASESNSADVFRPLWSWEDVRKIREKGRLREMADVNRFSEGLIDAAERFADVVDSAQGHGARKAGTGARWLILPAAGAAIYAVATSSSSMARQTRKLMRRAKDRATDLPDADLFGRVKEVTGLAEPSSSAGGARSQAATGRSQGQNRRRKAGQSQTQRRRKTTSAR
jgi:hypothetical protein